MDTIRIMFICTGNICRSPLAHAVFEHKVREAEADGIEAESSGTDAWHVGEQADPRMRRTAADHGVKLNHKARKLHRNDLADYDLLLAMDRDNLRNVLSLCRSESEREKVRMFRDFDPEGTGDVPDPWYGGPEGFELVWSLVERTCTGLLEEIQRGRKPA